MSCAINCPHCGLQMDNADMFVGLVACPACSKQFTILPPGHSAEMPLPPFPRPVYRSQPVPAPLPSLPLASQPPAFYGSPQPVSQQPVVIVQDHPASTRPYIPDKKSAGAAAVLSFFYIGLGQIYNGQILKGLVFMLIPPVAVFVWLLAGVAISLANENAALQIATLALAMLTYIAVWVWSMVDAHATAEWINHRHRRQYGGRGP